MKLRSILIAANYALAILSAVGAVFLITQAGNFYVVGAARITAILSVIVVAVVSIVVFLSLATILTHLQPPRVVVREAVDEVNRMMNRAEVAHASSQEPELKNGQWQCRCGRINDASQIHCLCGRVPDAII